MKQRIFNILLCLCLVFLTGCSEPSPDKPLSKTAVFFDTVVTICLYDSEDVNLLDAAFELCRQYENKFSRTIPTSEVAKINESSGRPVTVSKETITLIKKGLYYCRLSDGAFDITIAPLSELWNFKSGDAVIPHEEKIQEMKEHVSYENIIIDGNSVTLLDPDAALDLGGIAKGYIADILKAFLMENGVRHATVNLGGNVLVIGGKSDDTPFYIGIQKPFARQNETIATLTLKDKSVVSSGIYERYFEKDDKIYHHILNPKTGYPYENNLYQVTIICQSSADGDALSTACFAMGAEKGMELINQLDNTEAVFITEDYELLYSANMEELLSN